MIDKITPRTLDKSSDYRLVSKTSMIDALNVYITDDGDGPEGNVGTLKNIRGNSSVDYATEADYPSASEDSVLKVIGSVTDSKTKICYFFVWSQVAADHGIWAYDKYGKLPTSKTDAAGVPNSLRKIFTSNQFNFPEHGFVKGDVVYTNTTEFQKHDAIRNYLEENEGLNIDFEKDALLYFTDNVNEPRKVNIYRALLEKNDALAGSEYTNGNELELTDFICACPKVPLERITFVFDADAERSTNNFAASPGFQFAYQNIYKDKTESAISTYSEAAFPPSIVNRGAADVNDILAHNVCILNIPQAGPEVETIRLLARYGNSTNFFEIDEIGNNESLTENWDIDQRTYRFYNDRVASGVNPQEVNKTFDNVPRKAQAQTAISNRLIYGNYLEGFDNINTECKSKVIYNERPPDYLDLLVRTHASIEPTPYGGNRCVGFQIDTTEMPSNLSEGTIVNAVIEYQPDKNFHIYQAQNIKHTYHQSRHMGKYSANAKGYRRYPLENENTAFNSQGEGNSVLGVTNTGENLTNWDAYRPDTQAENQETGSGSSGGYRSAWDSGADYLERYGQRFFGRNWGVGAKGNEGGADWYENDGVMFLHTPTWRGQSMAYSSIIDTDPHACYGTSAGNPLILRSKNLRFQVRFRITQPVGGNGKKVISETIAEALAGADGGDGGLFTHAYAIEIEEVVNVARITKDEYDLGLGYETYDGYLLDSSFSFPTIGEGKDYSYLINAVGDRGHGSSTNSIQSETWSDAAFNITHKMPPRGYFIINKAEVDFYLEKVEDDELGGDAGNSHLRLCISKIDVDQEDVMTCIRKFDPQSPWWVVSSETASDPDFKAYWEGQSIFDLSDWGEWDEPGSFSSNFAISDPIFRVRNNPYDFAEKFDLNPTGSNGEIINYIGQGSLSGEIVPNALCHGYLDLSEHSLFKSHAEIFGTDEEEVGGFDNMYKPVLGESRFRFSLMDGEGGPGGSKAGGNSAYDNNQNARYGSIASQIYIDRDENDIKTTFVNNDGMCMSAYVGGARYGDEVDFGGPQATENTSFISQYGLETDDTGIGDPGSTSGIGTSMGDDYARFTYVVSGPFYTGCIAMNPVEGEGYNIQGRPLTPVRDFTTTLPLVWVNARAGTGAGTYAGQFNGAEMITEQSWGFNAPYNWLKTSFPWPQTISGIEGSWTSDGQMNSFPIDGLPFRSGIVNELDSDANFETDYYGGINGSNFDVAAAQSFFGCVDFRLTHSHLEGGTRSMFSPSGGFENNTSFKSSATHEFGIVYYDQRGRHGYVNHLDSVYVEGYNPGKRPVDGNNSNSQGSAHVQLTLMHTPPEWAHNYKIVYSKNTSVSDFIQYSSGGAWVAKGESPGSDPSRIYVSLNYLQGHEISYSSAWGARSEEGSPVMYTPKQGDRLRVISFMLDNVDNQNVPPRVYPYNYDFEVSDVVNLDDVDNPLADSFDAGGNLSPDENQKGLFLILKNNANAQGFRYQDVLDQTSYWGDNCIIELYSPTKELDADDRLYYEIGKTYDVQRDPTTGNLIHLGDGQDSDGNTTVLLTDGDVYFRSHAVNLRDYDASLVDGTYMGYTDIIINTTQELEETEWEEYKRSEANFKSYYLESPVATDLFKSNAIHIGRPNMIKQDAQESYKEASVIHSDRDIIDHGKVSYSSFNRSIPIDKDLDMKNGEINYLGNWDDSCFFVQKDKCGYFGIDRTMISDLKGEKSLIASSKFINEPQYYLGRAGADGNPESVYIIDNSAYFAHKSLGQVFKASGGGAGVQVISDINMRTWFKDLFNNVMMESMESGDDVRVVGGYDPMKQEYLLTVLSPETYGLITYPYIPDVKDYDPSVIVDDGDEPPRPNPSIDVTWANSSSPKFTAPPPAWNVGYTYEGYSSYSTALDPNNQVFYEADILEPRYIQVDLNNIDNILPGQMIKLTIELSENDSVSYSSPENTYDEYQGNDQNTRFRTHFNSSVIPYNEIVPGRVLEFVFNFETAETFAQMESDGAPLLIGIKFPNSYEGTHLIGDDPGNLYPKPNFVGSGDLNEDVQRANIVSYNIEYIGFDIDGSTQFSEPCTLTGNILWFDPVAPPPPPPDDYGTYLFNPCDWLVDGNFPSFGDFMTATDDIFVVGDIPFSELPILVDENGDLITYEYLNSIAGEKGENLGCVTDDGGNGGGPVYGCTNPSAANYNPAATVDDGSCVFTSPPPQPPVRRRNTNKPPGNRIRRNTNIY